MARDEAGAAVCRGRKLPFAEADLPANATVASSTAFAGKPAPRGLHSLTVNFFTLRCI
jgi:hypothetical protein